MEISFIQWNCLANWASYEKGFPLTNPDYLKWEYRKPLIIKEILSYHADILCLQEVDFYDDIKDGISKCGYSNSIFFKKKVSKDGLAIFIKDHLSFEKHSELIYSNGIHNLLDVSIVRKSCGTKIRVLTTHLKANYSCESTRIEQAKEFICHLNKEPSEKTMTIIAGDFNTFPDSETINMFYDESFKSVFSDIPWTIVSSRKDEIRRITYDYILYKNCELEEKNSNEFPDDIIIPNDHFPSDHIILFAKFKK